MKRLALVLPALLVSFACSSTRAARGEGSVVVLATPPSRTPGGDADHLRVGEVRVRARGGCLAFFESLVFEDEDEDGVRDPDETMWCEATLNGPLDVDLDVRTSPAKVRVTERTRQLVRIELASGLAHVEVWRVTAEGLLPLDDGSCPAPEVRARPSGAGR